MWTNESLKTDYRSIMNVALPVSLGIFVQFIVAFIDNYFVAQINGNAMSAASFVGLIYITLVMIGVGLGNATQILVARRKGEGDFNSAGQVTGNAFWMALVVALFQFIALTQILPGIIQHTIKSNEVRSYMMEFIDYRSYGFFFYSLTLVLNSFWSGIAYTRVMIYTTIITASVTILLDYGLVFGNLGLPNMGMAGAALATSIAEACAFLFLLIYTLYQYDHQHKKSSAENSSSYNLKKWLPSFNSAHTFSLIKLGGPIALQMVASLGIWVIFYEFVEDMGERELQSAFIVRNMYMLAYVSVGGFSTTTKTYISGLIAEKRQTELHLVMRKMMILNLVGIFFLSHGLWLYPEWIAEMFTTDPLVISQTVQSMHIVLPAMMTFAITSILLSTVEGSGNTIAGFIVEFITVILYIAAAWLMVYELKWPIHLVWTADYVYFLMLGVFSLAYLWNGKWKYKVI